MPVNMRASSSSRSSSVPDPRDERLPGLVRPTTARQLAACRSRKAAWPGPGHSCTGGAREVFEHPDQEIGHAPQDLKTKAIEPICELLHPQEVAGFNEGRLDRDNLTQMMLLAVVSMILNDGGRLLLGLKIGGPRGIDPLCRRESKTS